MKKDYSITYVGDSNMNNVHHIGVECNGNYYSVIFGEYVNGGFFVIPNWNCGGDLSDLDDISWNTESINKGLRKKKDSKAIACAIADFCET